MKLIHISERLQRVAACLPEGALFADIGSDHAYLPCYVCRQDVTARAIAGEINEGPFLSAKNTVKSAGLTDRIDVRRGNGLEILASYEVQQIVLSGMGSTLISDILQRGSDKMNLVDRIIVQPNTDERKVRRCLIKQRYAITYEELVEENGHIYEILVADKTNAVPFLTEKQLLFGPFLLQHPSALFYKKWLAAYKKRKKIVRQMKHANQINQPKIKQYTEELTWIKEILQYEKAGSDG